MAVVAIALAGLGLVAWLMPRRPLAAIGVVFMLAAPSAIGADLPVGTMRLEQPALAGLIALTIWHRRRLELPPVRPLWPLVAAGVVYLAALTASSALVAPDPAASLRLAAWSALSISGGLVTALLVAGRASRALDSFSAPGVVIATIGLGCGVAYLLFNVGPPWVLTGNGPAMPRVAAFTLEPNLYASLLAAVIPLALERWRARPSLAALATATVLLLALGLGVTRGAYIGLAAGLIVLFALPRLRAQPTAGLRAVAVLVIVAGGAGFLMPKVLLNPGLAGILANRPLPSPSTPAPIDELQTLEYRLTRLRAGLAEWPASPWIGLGAYSFGQTHFEASGKPDVIASWPILVLHDAGLIGLGGLLGLLGLLGLRLWRAAGDSARGPTATAYAAAVMVLLVAYLATTALHFAVTWLIFGGALGATIQWPRGEA